MEQKATRKQISGSSSKVSNSLEDSSDSKKESAGKKARNWEEDLKLIKDKFEEMTGARVKMPEQEEKWCVPCRVNTPSTSECVKCDYYERKGHVWKECPIRLAILTFKCLPKIALQKPQGRLVTKVTPGHQRSLIARIVGKKVTLPGTAQKK